MARGTSSRSSEPAPCRTPPAEAAGAEAGGGRGALRGAGGRPARPALEGRATGPGPQAGRCGLSQEGATAPVLWAQSGQVRHKTTYPAARRTRATGHGPRVQAGDVGGARGTERGRRGHRRHQGAPGRARRAELCPIGAAAAGCRRKPPAAFRQFEEAQTGTQTGDFTRLIVGVYPATRTGNPGPRAGSEAGGRPPLCVQTQANAEVQHRRTVFRDSARQLTSQSNDCPWARVTRADRPGGPPRRTPR